MSVINEDGARAIVDEYHAAWSRGDVTEMMACCHEDVQLLLNSGAPDGGPLQLNGKAELTAFLTPIVSIALCTTVPQFLTYNAGIARTRVAAIVKHIETGHVLSGTYRQIILLFDGPKIMDLNEFHDAAMMKAFWDLVETELAERKDSGRDD